MIKSIVLFCLCISLSIVASGQTAPERPKSAPVEQSKERPKPPAPQPQRFKLVESDLRKEFPKEDHIRLLGRKGVEVEEIYYGHNRSAVNAIYVNTSEKLSEEALKEIQLKIYRVLWDFDYANISTLFKHGDQFYAIPASDKKLGEPHSMIVYDLEELKKELEKTMAVCKDLKGYDLSEDDIRGIYFRPGRLSSLKKTDLAAIDVYIMAQNGDKITWNEGSRRWYNPFEPQTLYPNQEGRYRKKGGTVKVGPYGELMFHSDETNFVHKYSDYYFKID